MITVAGHWATLNPPTATFNDVPVGSTFYGYVERVVAEGVIDGLRSAAGTDEPCPGRYFRPNGTATRAQASKMVDIALHHHPTPTSTPTVTGTPPTNTPTVTGTPPTNTPTASRTPPTRAP